MVAVITKADVGVDTWRNVLLYGSPGSSKTTTAALYGATLPQGKKHLHVLTEGHHVGTVLTACPDADVIPVTSFAELRQAFEIARKGVSDGKYGSVALDSLDDMQDLFLRERHGEKFDAKGQGIQITTKDDYSAIRNATLQMCRAFRDLPVTTIFIAKASEKQIETDSGARRVIRPKVSGTDMDQTIVGMVHLAGYCFVSATEDDQVEYKILFRTTDDTILVKPAGKVRPVMKQNEIAVAIKLAEMPNVPPPAMTIEQAKAAKAAQQTPKPDASDDAPAPREPRAKGKTEAK